MYSIEVPAEVTAAFDALHAAEAACANWTSTGSSPLSGCTAGGRETSRRRQVAWSHDVIGGLAQEDPADLGGPPHQVIADWLRISYPEARRRIRDAEQLSPRLTLTGQQLPPELPATALAWREGVLDGQHLRVIQTFVHDLPVDTPVAMVEHAERFLAGQATYCAPTNCKRPPTAPPC